MKKKMIRCATVLLAFLAGIGFMSYMTRMGNRDMTGEMAEAALPVAYAEKDGVLYNEMHGYVEAMDGSSMRDCIIGVSDDHRLELAVEKYNARIESLSYEVRSLDGSRLVESGEALETEDDGRYLHVSLELKDLLTRGEKYLLILTAETDSYEAVYFYSLLSYLGDNHVEDCLEFAESFHDMTLRKDSDGVLNYLEQDGSMDGKSLGYVNIHSRSGPVTWGDMQVSQTEEPLVRLTELDGDVTALVMEYEAEDTQTGERYEVREAFRLRYTATRIYLLAYERWTDRIFEPGRQLVQDGEISFGIQSGELNYMENSEENVIGFVQQGQLWCYDFGQNRLSLVYGFEDGEDRRGQYGAHEFRILSVDDSGSMDFLVCGYMNRGKYEGRSGVLLCHYDALLNTVEELFFIRSSRPYEALKEDVGKLAVQNNNGQAWIAYEGTICQIELSDCSTEILAGGITEDGLHVSDSKALAAWNDGETGGICLLDTETGRVSRIEPGEGETLRALGFMKEDLIYGIARSEDISTDQAGRETVPMYCVVIRDHTGNEVREFEYASKGKYVESISVVENRIDLACIARAADGSWQETLGEPITYTSEPASQLLKLGTVYDDTRRNEYVLSYEGTIKNGSMKRPNVRLVLYEQSRTIEREESGDGLYLAYSYDGQAAGFETLSEAVIYAYDAMGSVWKDGTCRWDRGGRKTRTQIEGFEDPETISADGSPLAQCLQLLLRQRQIYTDVQAEMDQGAEAWEILQRELGEDCALLPGCSLSMALYYVSAGSPVAAVTPGGGAALIVGYDAQNIIYYEPGRTELTRLGMNDGTAMFEEAGSLFFSCLP
ncbi:MAG: hypothetical protein Q4C82_03610 [Eubacteriales bacterium]|nr:hypothetical protein [Eubacteriales bacterium]